MLYFVTEAEDGQARRVASGSGGFDALEIRSQVEFELPETNFKQSLSRYAEASSRKCQQDGASLSCSQRQPHVYTVYMFKSLFESIMIHAIVPYYQALLLMQGRSAQFKNLKHNLIMFFSASELPTPFAEFAFLIDRF